MSGFDAHWLALREPADARSRSEAHAAELARWAAVRSEGRALRLVDLGSGSGSNLRYLGARLPVPQHWMCVDDDEALLSHALREARQGLDIETRKLDLALRLDEAIGAQVDVVTASALLDLVSVEWLAALATALTHSGAAGLFALSVEGRCRFEPPQADDDRVQAAFDAHQRRDKGFGAAAGSGAVAVLMPLLERRGYRVATARSDWVLDARDAELMVPLLEGIASAAIEQGGDAVRAAFTLWLQQRLAQVQGGTLRVVIGHLDLLALPPQ